ncbi:polysaccharide deacetylase family protein [Caballeronia sp. LZ025]|uniref:polysaccharide deacetylase family protein n=1 Tax=Caballeronia TaxID=1827195 RepID=UPI001FCFC86B|nr:MULTISPECIES: polysaccharide deacetylase family protein [Caballeronia]MDR5735800.1 polysaccharide deacetylase family protein [Caballeronia sp. LZ025]
MRQIISRLRAEAPRRWPRTGWPPMVIATFAWHGVALCGWLLRPSAWIAWLASVAVSHIVVVSIGLWPRSKLLGPNWTRLPDTPSNADAVALTIDDGPDPVVTPKVLDILDRHRVRATFFCIGTRAAEHPALVREIVARGHAVENHTHRHVHTFSVTLPLRLAKEIDSAQHALETLTGERPMFFRAPAGLRNLFLEPVLHRLDLRLAAWTRRGFDTREGDADRILERLTDGLAARDILLVHDAGAALTSTGDPVVLAVLPRLIDIVRSSGLRFVTLRDARASLSR